MKSSMMDVSAIILWVFGLFVFCFFNLGFLFFWKEDKERYILSAGRMWVPPASRSGMWEVAL